MDNDDQLMRQNSDQDTRLHDLSLIYYYSFIIIYFIIFNFRKSLPKKCAVLLKSHSKKNLFTMSTL